jgi:hypothetical protein
MIATSEQHRWQLYTRILLAVNTVLLVVSFFPWFAGTPGAAGVADHLFGHLTFGGFRFDVVWLVLAFIATSIWTFFNLAHFNVSPSHRLNGLLGLAWCAGFIYYVHHIITSGLLWMG